MAHDRSHRTLPFLVVFLFVGGLAGQAATYVVDDDGGTPWQTIQSAINVAQPGDEVFVRCGIYRENVLLRNGVHLRGENAGCTILDGGHAGTALRTTTEQPQSVEGLTIRNGLSSGTSGIAILSGSPIITRNIIANNGDDGGGTYAFYGYYGGISVAPGTSPVISYNVIRGNVGFLGGGLGVQGAAGASVRSNVVAGNSSYFGGGLYVSFGEVDLVNNTIYANSAGYAGGLWVYNADVQLTNNVVAANQISGFGSAGGLYAVGPANLSYISNNFYGNAYWDGLQPGVVGSYGNISEEPRFVDVSTVDFAGFQPRNDSPLIDAGGFLGAPLSDLRSIPRPQDGDVNGIGRPDIGARENEGVTGLVHDADRFAWDPGHQVPELYNLYRGDLGTLRATGVYTQDPVDVAGARHFCGITGELGDAEEPTVGAAFFYLVANLGAVEGTLGFDGTPAERPRTVPCTP